MLRFLIGNKFERKTIYITYISILILWLDNSHRMIQTVGVVR